MADFEVKLPPLGEDAPDEATVSFFFVEEGSDVKEGDDFCEMVTDKATFNVPSPVAGRVKKIVAKEDELVPVGGLLAIVET
jgi:2-oxoglutarate dehydrogenase E2 component (dihydrolipoamide succinyltransferase)